MTTERNIAFEETCNGPGDFPVLIPTIHAWLLENLATRDIMEGVFQSCSNRAYSVHDPKARGRQTRYALRRYKNYVIGFIEDWDAIYEFLPDRVYRHIPLPHHMCPIPPSYDFGTQLALNTDYAMYTPNGVQIVWHRRLKKDSSDHNVPPEIAWVAIPRGMKTKKALLATNTIATSNGQLIRDIEDIIRPTTALLFAGWFKPIGQSHFKGGYWWNRTLRHFDPPSKIQSVVKLRNGFEAFDPAHPELIAFYEEARVMIGATEDAFVAVDETLFEEFVVRGVSRLAKVIEQSSAT